jgi:hypothetical protein
MGDILSLMQSKSLIVAYPGDSNCIVALRNRGPNPMLHIFTGINWT